LLDRAVRITPHETYHLAANYGSPAVRGFSPVDLFGFDKVFLSPREVVNRLLATHSIEAPDMEELCHSIEGTAWKDYFVNGYTSEYSRLALVELNRKRAVPSGSFMVESNIGKGSVICSQLLPDPESDKALRLYSRLLANLGAVLGDGLLASEKSDAEWAVEAMMALPCPVPGDFADMKAYFTDPAYSLNNLGEGLYGWMQKKERHPSDGTMHIANNGEKPWFLTCFVHVPDREGSLRPGRLRVLTTASHQIYLNGGLVSDPMDNLSLKGGINRLIAVVYPDGGDFSFGIVFLNRDGTYMKDLEYRMTLNEVEPK
ncbi:glycoside hydrolase family 2, partial [Paenibacillus chibensis]|nr:glycoside hydrolase family 2 [Paenibacillus chibensis]